MYLASAGWALTLGVAYQVLAEAKPRPVNALGRGLLAAAILAGYGFQLLDEVRLWGVRSAVSRKVVSDIAREAAAAPRGTLIVVDPPQRSSNFAMPYAVQPPFTSDDVAAKVSIISHSSIHCCASYFWEPVHPERDRALDQQSGSSSGRRLALGSADRSNCIGCAMPTSRSCAPSWHCCSRAKTSRHSIARLLGISSGMVLRPAS